MSILDQSYFTPITLSHVLRHMGDIPFYGQVFGSGEIHATSKVSVLKKFILVRRPKGNGEYYCYPILIPEWIEVGDLITLVKNKNKVSRMIMMIDKTKREKAKKVFIGMALDKKSGEQHPWRESVEYALVDGNWVLAKADGKDINFFFLV